MRVTPIWLLLLTSVVALANPAGLLSVGAADTSGCVPVGAWVDPASGGRRDDVIATFAKRSVVLLGETHDDAEHHRWQLHTIAALYSHRPDMVLGFEMFPRHVQPVLDRWSKGELNEAALLREVDWPQIWGTSADLYLPLFHFARMHRLPMLALNVDRARNRGAAAQGGARAPSATREVVGDPAAASSSYRDRLLETFRQHPAGGETASADSEQFARFVAAQLLWDRAMAEAIIGAQRDGRRPLVVGIVGSGHVEYGDGIVHQLAALGLDDVATALPWRADADCPARDPKIADALFGVSPPVATRTSPPRLGVTVSAVETGVRVEGVAAQSIAEAIGLRMGDVIENAAGVGVRQPADLVAIVRRQAPGTWLPLSVRRGEEGFEMVARFPAER
jgi:uncharacterized iron-regulated protein